MSLEPGTTLGPYEVVAEIGRGGMGEVYRARDTKLDRDVALKVLPQAFTEDADRLARFEREAKVLASLNHPNIGHIYGLEEAAGQKALVLELVEGPTLADRIKQGPIPVDEALPIARQIAEALEAAHEQGVIHRDLKPANIKVRDDGMVKVLDFGLAKAFQPDESDVSASMSPTISLTAAATQMGMVIGTAAYMAPEQASGKVVDKRADIWAFGVVVYEMLTGTRPFRGDDVSHTLAAVLMKEIDWTALSKDTPDVVRRLLRRSLERDPRKRMRDIGEARIELEDPQGSPMAERGDPFAPPQLQVWQRPIPAGIVAVMIAAVAGLAGWGLVRSIPSPPGTVTRFPIILPNDDLIDRGDGIDLSPDGTTLVYAGQRNGVQQLFVRTRDQTTARPLPGTEGGVDPFFSPDGVWVGFFTRDSLKKIALAGGPPVTLCPVGARGGAAWGPDDTIVFNSTAAPGLMQVPAAGGEPRPLTEAQPGEQEHRFPAFVSGASAVLYTIRRAGGLDAFDVAVVSLDTAEQQTLVQGASGSVTASGHLVFARQASLWAVPFDNDRLTVSGEPVPIVEGVRVNNGGWAHYASADDGTLVYLPAVDSLSIERTLLWVDRDGRDEPVAAAPADYQEFNLSPDGTRVAVRIAGDDPAVWIYDLIRDTSTRLTFESDVVSGLAPTWTSDGTRVAFSTPLAWKNADGTGDVETLSDDGRRVPQAFSPDGTTLVFEERAMGGRWGLGMLTLDGDRAATVLLDDDEFDEWGATLSPDGRWLAYSSDETGRSEVYVRPFPDADTGKWQISTDGGDWSLWNPAGDELFYRGPTGVMAVEFEGDPTFAPGAPRLLIEREIIGSRFRRMAVSPNGHRFLLLTDATGESNLEDVPPPQIHVVLNWHSELLERVPIP